jgi:hypothetical protein
MRALQGPRQGHYLLPRQGIGALVDFPRALRT